MLFASVSLAIFVMQISIAADAVMERVFGVKGIAEVERSWQECRHQWS